MSPRQQANRNSESVDNYLKAILSLGGPEQRRVTSTALADRLGVAPASITNMLQKLAAAATPLVEYERHRGVQLSAGGKRRALETQPPAGHYEARSKYSIAAPRSPKIENSSSSPA